MLVILHIRQDGRLDSNVEVVTLVGAHRDETGTHLETVHRARDAAVHVGNLVGVEIIACHRCQGPVLGRTDAGIHTQVMSPTAVILQLVKVERAVAIG